MGYWEPRDEALYWEFYLYHTKGTPLQFVITQEGEVATFPASIFQDG